ncbi:MAG: PilZ domain-containing protein [Actinomycetota bacterium]
MSDAPAGLPGLTDRNAVDIVDERGAAHTGEIRRWGSAFVEIDLTEFLRGDFPPGSTVQLHGEGIGREREGRVVRSGRRLVVQLAVARERRVHPRVPFHQPVRWRRLDDQYWRWGRSEDLSNAGIRLLLDDRLPVGREIELAVRWAPTEELSVRGTILAVTPIGRWWRARVRFMEEPEGSISGLVDRLAGRSV